MKRRDLVDQIALSVSTTLGYFAGGDDPGIVHARRLIRKAVNSAVPKGDIAAVLTQKQVLALDDMIEYGIEAGFDGEDEERVSAVIERGRARLRDGLTLVAPPAGVESVYRFDFYLDGEKLNADYIHFAYKATSQTIALQAALTEGCRRFGVARHRLEVRCVP